MPSVKELGHVGLFVKDPAVMIEFYRDFIGLQVTDRAKDDWIVFLSARPEQEHHELALMKAPEKQSEVQQLSWVVGSLADLKGFWQQIKARGYPVDMVVSHGNAFGCYFRDPEGNRVELYWKTGRDCHQPRADRIDLDLPEEELLALVEELPLQMAVAS